MTTHPEKHNLRAWTDINKHKLGKGIKKPRFRKAKQWVIQNRILMAVLIVEDVKLSELAKEVGVAPRTVASWIYEGVKPTEEYRAHISHKFGLPQSVLFFDDRHYDQIPAWTGKRFLKRVLLGEKKNRILTGLFAVHDLSPSDFSKEMNLAPATTRKYMHQGKKPAPEVGEIYCSFFGLPEEILFYETERRN
ncbi:XRE family transcriptional regulator [Paenibacillus sp. J2TS4]|uniref:XRE family transcriptional regulator n=1 Tax=Paenibacillus sp. J2TS4 TaxID=2807194 RepID=UPI001B0BD37A|nr:XRE family transcriptional regulator [Paenibacillus sp. J2TS4]GIP36152.1 hypothetical protein J2TS4_53620 [Paenibacillus sp. J2TS4]